MGQNLDTINITQQLCSVSAEFHRREHYVIDQDRIKELLASRVARLRTLRDELRVHSTTGPRNGVGKSHKELRVERCAKEINSPRTER